MTMGVVAQKVTTMQKDLKSVAGMLGRPTTEVIDGMKTIGMKHAKAEETGKVRTYTMRGDFGSEDKCVALTTSNINQADSVSNIGIFFPNREKWELLEADYRLLQRELRNAFGAEREKSEFFDKGENLSNEEKMAEFAAGRCDYTCQFNSGSAVIFLSLTYSEDKGAHASVLFLDKKRVIPFFEHILGGSVDD